ncbi:MAG: ornithine carbamoyltransferase [Gemmatimonadota bacterium]|nr:ornithine carbamoyltransferase [Gemmatimonadota bacterium]
MKKDFISIDDYSPGELKATLLLAARLKEIRRSESDIKPLAGRSMAMLFEKPSLRTRVTFELAMIELGGHSLMAQPAGVRLGERESVPDLARNLERWVDVVTARVFKNRLIRELAANTGVPVINALCDLEHPCQALADMQTIIELAGARSLDRVKLAYMGDGNNVCHSLMLISSVMGIGITVGTPKGYEPQEGFVRRSQEHCRASGGTIELTNDPREAVAGADFIYTDVWASMGQEDEHSERLEVFRPFQVNSELVSGAADDFCILHCLPAHRGEEITDEVLDSPHCRVFDQAENRLHAQKAVILTLLAPEAAQELLERG